jgi:hypothetical protein
VSGYITRPRDLDGAGLRELLDGYEMHTSALVNHEHGIGRPEPVARLRSSALDALCIGAQVEQRMRNERWTTVRDALRLGASVDDVATALDLTVAEVTAGLRSWADGQHRHGLLTTEQYAEVYALLRGSR